MIHRAIRLSVCHWDSFFKEKTHSFIVRIWLESREIEAKVPELRGMIEHVTSEKQQYFQDLT